MIDTSQWKYFDLTGDNGIFRIEPCKCSNAGELLEDGSDIEYIGAKKDDNGVMYLVKYNDDLVTKCTNSFVDVISEHLTNQTNKWRQKFFPAAARL